MDMDKLAVKAKFVLSFAFLLTVSLVCASDVRPCRMTGTAGDAAQI